MFCQKCGTQLDNNTKFCAVCGTPVGSSDSSTAAQSTPNASQGQYASQHNPSPQPSAANASFKETSAKKKLKWWHILLIVIGGLIVLITLISVISGSGDDNNGGYVSDYGNNGNGSNNIGSGSNSNTNNSNNGGSQNSGDIAVGSTIKFGSYEQDGDYDNGDEDIEWIVLESVDNKLLLISKYVLDATPYTYSENGAAWNNSAAYSCLEDTIYKHAFSYQERKKLTTCTIITEQEKFTSKDKVFALSSHEIEKYGKIVDGLYDCYPTKYAKSKGVATSSSEQTAGMSYWWVRDEGAFGTVMAPTQVAWVGAVYKDTQHGVRPAIWVNKDYKITINDGTTINKNMVGTWETVSGADEHYIVIRENGELDVYDGPDKLTMKYVCYSSTEIGASLSQGEEAGYVFVLDKDKLVRYDDNGLLDGYAYKKKTTSSSTESTETSTTSPTISQTPSNNTPETNKAVYGAASLDVLKTIMSSDFLFSKKQIDCMTMSMFAWTYNRCVNQGTQSRIADRDTNEVEKDINEYLFDVRNVERMKIKVGSLVEYDVDLYTDALLKDAEQRYGTAVYSIIKNEKSKLQGIWAANYKVTFESGMSLTVYADDYEMDMDMYDDFFIYKIDGRYYWSYINIYT